MNKISIWAPRWKDRKVLIADWKIGMKNEITITCTNAKGDRRYPEPFIMSGEKLATYPVVNHEHGKMREVPLDDLLTHKFEQKIDSMDRWGGTDKVVA